MQKNTTFVDKKERSSSHSTNHSQNFKVPETGIHTNTIESNWQPLKRKLQDSEKKYLADQCQYLY